MRPIRVAVIGGGCASLTAAFELSRPEHRGRYEVTVYQLGWRLGGKGAADPQAASRSTGCTSGWASTKTPFA